MVLLTGCQKKETIRSDIVLLKLPALPLMDIRESEELKKVCTPKSKCDNINIWMNELIRFEMKYNEYREFLQGSSNK
jgi:hypothetical protein